LAGENFTETRAGAVIAENSELVFLVISRKKKGQSLDVIPMGM